MIGDWIFIVLLILIFIVVLVLSILIIKSANGITPALRKSDTSMYSAYSALKIGGYIGEITSIIGLVVMLMAILVVAIGPLSRSLDGMHRWAKISIKTLYGIITAVMIIVAGAFFSHSARLISNSRTYRIARLGARKELDASINSINTAAIAYYALGTTVLVLFIMIAFYDGFKSKEKPKPSLNLIDDQLGRTDSTTHMLPERPVEVQ